MIPRNIRPILALAFILLCLLGACSRKTASTESEPTPVETTAAAQTDAPTPTATPLATATPETEEIPVEAIPELKVQDEYVVEMEMEQGSDGW